MKSFFLISALLLSAITIHSQTLAYADTITTTSGDFMLETNVEPGEVSFNQQTQVAQDGGYAEQLNFYPSSSRTGRTSVEGKISFSINPNPTLGNVTLNLINGGSDLTVKIMDISGRMVSIQTFYATDGAYLRSLDLSGYSNGIYFVDINTGGEHFTHKLVKQ